MDIIRYYTDSNVPILYPLKAPEDRGFSGVFRGHKLEHLQPVYYLIQSVSGNILTKHIPAIGLLCSLLLLTGYKICKDRQKSRIMFSQCILDELSQVFYDLQIFYSIKYLFCKISWNFQNTCDSLFSVVVRFTSHWAATLLQMSVFF